jgi:hypothetical protein
MLDGKVIGGDSFRSDLDDIERGRLGSNRAGDRDDRLRQFGFRRVTCQLLANAVLRIVAASDQRGVKGICHGGMGGSRAPGNLAPQWRHERGKRTLCMLNNILDSNKRDDYASKDFYHVQQTAGGLPDGQTFDWFLGTVLGHLRGVEPYDQTADYGLMSSSFAQDVSETTSKAPC